MCVCVLEKREKVKQECNNAIFFAKLGILIDLLHSCIMSPKRKCKITY